MSGFGIVCVGVEIDVHELMPARPRHMRQDFSAKSLFLSATIAVSDIDSASKASGTGCADCMASNGWWFHLRRCAKCGHIGCCDSSPGQHARAHAAQSGHRVIASFEPGEDWFYDFKTDDYVEGGDLHPPRWHPENQPVPGPQGRVPRDWQKKLHQ